MSMNRQVTGSKALLLAGLLLAGVALPHPASAEPPALRTAASGSGSEASPYAKWNRQRAPAARGTKAPPASGARAAQKGGR